MANPSAMRLESNASFSVSFAIPAGTFGNTRIFKVLFKAVAEWNLILL